VKKVVLSIVIMMSMVIILSGCNLTGLVREVISVAEAERTAEQPQNPPREQSLQSTDVQQEQPPVEMTPAQIFDENADAVFTIYTSFDDSYYESMGSGFFVSESGIAVTNHHVIVGWPYAFIRTHSGVEFDILGYYSYDADNDLAIIQVDGNSFPYVTIGDSENLRIGDRVYAIGSPLGYHNTFSDGIISRFDEVGEFGIYRVYGMIQTTVPISGGSSGGALLNDSGEVIGVTTAGYSGAFAQALNFAVPSARIDLSGTEDGNYFKLPVGELVYIPNETLIGSWVWDGGHYFFGAEGTGDRVWDGYPESFEWRMSGSVLVLYFDNDEYERWTVSIINEDEITIGGAFFARTIVPDDPTEVIIGTWNWHAGWYAFAPDGFGSRMWSGDADTFKWAIIDGTIIFGFDDGREEKWDIQIISYNDITIGGAQFTRTGN